MDIQALILQALHWLTVEALFYLALYILAYTDFSVSKYFRSYCREIIHGSQVRLPEEIEDVVICININLNEANLNAYGIELVPNENLLDIVRILKKIQSSIYRLMMSP
jgi:hypothetical protein